jgi:hypothetical protein
MELFGGRAVIAGEPVWGPFVPVDLTRSRPTRARKASNPVVCVPELCRGCGGELVDGNEGVWCASCWEDREAGIAPVVPIRAVVAVPKAEDWTRTARGRFTFGDWTAVRHGPKGTAWSLERAGHLVGDGFPHLRAACETAASLATVRTEGVAR